MKKEVKKLLAYLLALVIAITSVFTGQIVTKTTVKAATLENDGTEITAESEAPVEITTNAEGQTVYTLTGNVTNGLKITLAAGETVILDGKGYSIHGRDEIEDEFDSATPALEIDGSGTLILKNADLTGGNGIETLGYDGQGAVGLRVTSPNVSLILQQTVTITGGTAAAGATAGQQSGNGSSGIKFSGAALKVDSGSQVTIKGSDGYQGVSGNKYGDGRVDGTPGGCALNFTGGSLLVRDDARLTLTGGNGGRGDSGYEKVGNWYQINKKAANGTNGGNGGDALSFKGSFYAISSGATVTYMPGTRGTGGAAGTYYTDDDSTTLASGEAGSDGSAGLKLVYTSGLVPDKTLLRSALSEGDEEVSVTLHYSDYTQTYYAKKGSTINPAYLPDTEYYTVTKWCTDKNLQTPVDTGETITLTQDTDFYAATFKVRFSTGEDTISVEDQAVTYPEAVTRPKDPTKTGYTFGGWYTDEACTNAYDFSQPVTKDMTLYAKWTINTYTVSFDSLCGSPVDVETADYETAVTKPEDPTRTGYTFGGWYTDEACTNAYDFSQPLTKDMTLHAKWTINTYTVTFDSLEGSPVDVETADYETAVTKPEDPTKTGYSFGGWYTDEACTKAYDFATPVTGDRILYAKWNEIPRPTGTPQPTKAPEPTVIPTSEPTKAPQPTVIPTSEPTKAPQPTVIPTSEPTGTPQPTKAPQPTVIPTSEPTKAPEPTVIPTSEPTGTPEPTKAPEPTVTPTSQPTKAPEPTVTPAPEPTKAPEPTVTPTPEPTKAPEPIVTPTSQPTAGPQPASTVTLNVSSLVLQKGKSTTAVKVTLIKGDSIEKWESSDTKVATVTKKGKIKAKKAGTAVITVTTKRGASASVEVKVQKKKVKTQKLTVTNVKKRKLTLKKGKTFKIKTERTPLTSQEKITFKSSDKEVAKVSKNGKIKALKAGKTVITVKSGTEVVKIKVTVKKK